MRTRNLRIFAVVVATLATLTASGPVLAAATNVLNVSVNHGPSGAGIDQPYGHATVCVPGTNTCQRIDRHRFIWPQNLFASAYHRTARADLGPRQDCRVCVLRLGHGMEKSRDG